MFSLKASQNKINPAWSALNHKSWSVSSRYVFNLYDYKRTVQTEQQEARSADKET